jgi:hypothetical protein
MFDLHSDLCGGYHFWKTTAHKIIRAGYYWPTLFTDVCREVRDCIKCQRFSRKKQLKSLPLKPVVSSAPFQQWGLDFIGKIHPPSSGQHKWILTATNYFVITEISSAHGDKNSASSNSNEVIHGTELISQHCKKVKNYTK